ncbi:hypothetical protein RGQ13_15150 [Thalassotalea psychrophila]|uniref:Uncharacterized protein n=1 Tax=Thalassotalea psychrophila TaxID=3065647 RepID=A0ABY9TUR5_9GAMM|nr:hypothetical protein RGQ13_15150 [Colwelliaceae bacterium SQ149]
MKQFKGCDREKSMYLKHWATLTFNYESPNLDEFFPDDSFSFATALLAKGNLPLEAGKAYAHAVMEASQELIRKKRTAPFINPSKKAGNKAKPDVLRRVFKCMRLISSGMMEKEAWELVANEDHRSVDTVRLEYQKYIKRNGVQQIQNDINCLMALVVAEGKPAAIRELTSIQNMHNHILYFEHKRKSTE